MNKKIYGNIPVYYDVIHFGDRFYDLEIALKEQLIIINVKRVGDKPSFSPIVVIHNFEKNYRVFRTIDDDDLITYISNLAYFLQRSETMENAGKYLEVLL